jgi:CRP-like cAMP-binding protein
MVDQASIDTAFAKSAFADLPADTRRQLTVGARQVRLSSKEYFFHIGDEPRSALLVRGFIRTMRTHPDGRELTISWEYPGFLGVTSVMRPPLVIGVQAVTDTTFLELSTDAVRERAMTDVTVAWAIARLGNSLLRRAIDEIVIFALGDLRSRVEWRILEAACRSDPPATPLVADVTQDELALAVGAARPSVARILKTLRDEGTIRSMYGGILVLRPKALAPLPHRHEVA